MSFQLPALIEKVGPQKVWLLTGDDRYAQIPVVDDKGKRLLYAIIFSLERNKGREHPLRVYVRSAHLYDRKPPDTFGEVKFAHLLKLRIANKHPNKNHDRGRKRPKMPWKANGPFRGRADLPRKVGGAKHFEVTLYPRIRRDRHRYRWRWLCARPITSDLLTIVGRGYAIVNG